MSKIDICLGGANNGKIINSNEEFYYAAVGGDIIVYKRVALKFRKVVIKPHFEKDYVLKQPFNIYVPESEYDKYEGTLKFILSKWMESDWEEL